MLDVRKLRLLRELAHRGTIAAVADALAYTPSAVSQQLSALEHEAGVALLERSGRRVVLTAAATALVEYAERILALLDQASAMLDATRGELVGPLRIGAFNSAVRTILPAALIALGRAHPALELMVTELDPAAAPNALRGGEVDVALVHEYDCVPRTPEPWLEIEPLLEETIYLASGPEAARAGAANADAADPIVRVGRPARWIVGSPDTLCHTMALRLCQQAGFTPNIRHHADDFATVLALVAAGQGVALVPQLGAVDPPDGVLLTPLAARRRTGVAVRAGRRGDPAVAAFSAAIRAASADWLQRAEPGPAAETRQPPRPRAAV
jgi:DNA-binding transcriptional LysR family regulator